MRKLSICIFSLLCALCVNVLEMGAKVTFPVIFGDNMVLQQNAEVPFWGKAAPGKTVKVKTSWNGETYKTVAEKDGSWKVTLQTSSYGGPYDINVSDGKSVTFHNVMLGEVWLCSGQSNMEMPLAGWGRIDNYEQEIANAHYPDIRLFQVSRETAYSPQYDCKATGWNPCSPTIIPDFSATAYFFARNLYEKYHIPIGLIHSSWGGTFAEAWTSTTALKNIPAFKESATHIENISAEVAEMRKNYAVEKKAWDEKFESSDRGMAKEKWFHPSYNDNDWKQMNLPGLWEEKELPGFDGLVWFRKQIDVPASWKGKDLCLSLGNIDDDDITYFNGVEVGRSKYGTSRLYNIPAKLVKEKGNVVAVRVLDSGGNGGFYGESVSMKLSLSDNNFISLAGEWKYNISIDMKKFDPMPQDYSDPFHPGVLFNAMIHPLIPYTIRGVIWYQGEANAGRAYQYRDLLPVLIQDWRRRWNSDFPFYIVQLAAFMDTKENPEESDWAELREAQLKTLSLENTGLAVAIDIGDAKDIHPKNKQEVGRRLALIAMADTYGDKIEYSGPLYDSYRIEGDTIRIRFTHAESGLKTPDGSELKGFAIAGPDHKFYWAEARIEGKEVMVYSPHVKMPVAVRYAWAYNPICNLYNGEGLPASPFRTDDWDGWTRGKK